MSTDTAFLATFKDIHGRLGVMKQPELVIPSRVVRQEKILVQSHANRQRGEQLGNLEVAADGEILFGVLPEAGNVFLGDPDVADTLRTVFEFDAHVERFLEVWRLAMADGAQLLGIEYHLRYLFNANLMTVLSHGFEELYLTMTYPAVATVFVSLGRVRCLHFDLVRKCE